MSDNEYSNTDSSSAENNEHYIFVKLLANYKVLLGTEKFPNSQQKKGEAALAFCKEYNKICSPMLTKRKVLKKVCNMKARLKEKNFKNLTRIKKLEYTDWERKFLDLWVGSGITVFANKSTEFISHPAVPVENQRRNPVYESNSSLNVINQPENSTPEDITIKIEDDDDDDDIFLQDAHSSPISRTISTNHCEANLDDATSASHCEVNPDDTSSINHSGAIPDDTTDQKDGEDEENNYESMTLDELKRIALVAQIKLINDQRAAAKSKTELNQYKLSLLKRAYRDE